MAHAFSGEFFWLEDAQSQCIYVNLPNLIQHTYIKPEITIRTILPDLYAFIRDKSGISSLKIQPLQSNIDSYFHIDLSKVFQESPTMSLSLNWELEAGQQQNVELAICNSFLGAPINRNQNSLKIDIKSNHFSG